MGVAKPALASHGVLRRRGTQHLRRGVGTWEASWIGTDRCGHQGVRTLRYLDAPRIDHRRERSQPEDGGSRRISAGRLSRKNRQAAWEVAKHGAGREKKQGRGERL